MEVFVSRWIGLCAAVMMLPGCGGGETQRKKVEPEIEATIRAPVKPLSTLSERVDATPDVEVKPTLATELPPRVPAPVTLAGGFTSIPIELPVITIRKLRATVTVPDGGTVLLGGLKNFDEFEGVSGVPFLMRIPLLNNLFRRQAFQRLRASLVVLLKADITIIREREKDIFGRD